MFGYSINDWFRYTLTVSFLLQSRSKDSARYSAYDSPAIEKIYFSTPQLRDEAIAKLTAEQAMAGKAAGSSASSASKAGAGRGVVAAARPTALDIAPQPTGSSVKLVQKIDMEAIKATLLEIDKHAKKAAAIAVTDPLAGSQLDTAVHKLVERFIARAAYP